MSVRRYLSLLYYSQIHLALLAFVLASSISAVLYHQFNWSVSLIVGLSTYFTYSLDNLFDWKKDQHRYLDIIKPIRKYHKITYFLIPLSALIVLLLTVTSSNELKIGILLLGSSAGMLTARFANYRQITTLSDRSIIYFFINRIFISLVWTIVVVFLPVWYDGRAVNSLTWHTLIYIFNLVLVYATLWKFEKIDPELKKQIVHRRLLNYLVIPLLISTSIVIYDIVSGLRTWLSVFNLPPVVISLFFIYKTTTNPFQLRLKMSMFTFLIFISIAVSVVIHLGLG